MADYQSVLTKVGLTAKRDANDAENKNIFDMSGTVVTEITSHSLANDYVINVLTRDDSLKELSAVDYDMKALIEEFTKICLDYNTTIQDDVPSKALEFVKKILFEVGPESRTVRKNSPHKEWRFRFPSNGVAIVCTFKNSNGVVPKVKNNGSMILTIKEASLLALHKLCTIMEGFVNEGHVLLTPLARAIFSKNDLDDMLAELKAIDPRLTKWQLVNIINCSCQSGGQYLQSSRSHTAVAAVIAATNSMKDMNTRKKLIIKKYKEYNLPDKKFDKQLFTIYSKYATGGVPLEFSVDVLLQLFQNAQTTRFNSRDVNQVADILPIGPPAQDQSSD